MTTICGIDFGTSNSAIAVCCEGTTTLVAVEGAETTIPSAIFYPAGGQSPLYGRAGMAAYGEHSAGRLMRSLKSILGSDLIMDKTAVGGRYVSFEDILVGFVRHLKAKAESHAGARIDKVVMGRPVHFVDDNEVADARAEAKLAEIARQAGFKKIAFQFEPIAAALSFEHTLTSDELVFIADIGGGTADFSVVEVGPGRRGKRDRSADILANDGIRVGGATLDMRLSLEAVMPHLGSTDTTKKGRNLPRWPFVDLATWHRIHTIASPKNLVMLRQILADCAEPERFERYMEVVRRQTGHQLAAQVERAKIELTTCASVDIDLEAVAPSLHVTTDTTQFEAAISHELDRLAATVDATLDSSGQRGAAISTLFLTGGTSAVPAVRQMLARLLPQAKAIEGDLFNSVGFGLALDAERRFGSGGRQRTPGTDQAGG